MLWSSVTRVISEEFTSSTIIFNPFNGAKALGASPKVVLASFWYWIIGENHDKDCECDVCTYRKDTTHVDQVNVQRETVERVYQDIKRRQEDWYTNGQENMVTVGEATWWDSFFATEFPEVWKMNRYAYGDGYIIDLLHDINKERLPELLVRLVLEIPEGEPVDVEEVEYLAKRLENRGYQEIAAAVRSMPYV